MSQTAARAGARLRQLLRSARAYRGAFLTLTVLPIWLAASALLLRCLSLIPAMLLIATAASVLVLALLAALARIDRVWLARRLERQRDFDDSAALLFADAEQLPQLERLQQARLQERLLSVAIMPVATPWRWRTLLCAWALGVGLFSATRDLAIEVGVPVQATPAALAALAASAKFTELAELRLRITPPAYTGLPERTQREADASVPEASLLSWSLALRPQPLAANLNFHDDTRLPLRPSDGGWTASRTMQRSSLYRLEIDSQLPLKNDLLRRIEVIADQPPRIVVRVPERSLTLATPGQQQWKIEFEASDDYGLGPARLQTRHATGSGENISLSERSESLAGSGDAQVQRYTRTLDLRALGFAQGDDLIVRLAVSDQRTPLAQTALSANYILRWPDPPASESAGVAGLVEKVLPAYLRSQRQIIIDSEALLAERAKLDPPGFAERSDLIGVDQRVLRLRYGQFLGEEADEGPDADGDHHDGAESTHGAEPPEAGPVGSPASVLEQFGHTHDDAEAATLLEPQTRKLLKAALNEMWQAELALRQGQPHAALPFERRALAYIKQVQQASRIYLARVGLELPPVDPTRRLTGDPAGLRSRADPARAATPGEPAPGALWKALESSDTAALTNALTDAQRWARERESTLTDALGLLAAIDALGRDPACAECKARLRRRLWPLLPQPPAAALLRPQMDARGRAYLRALAPAQRP